MDESVRAEYQRRLAAGDQYGALAYLRMLRTQATDPAEREAYNQAIAEIEGRSAADESQYGQSAGPFGDQPAAWAAEHTPPASIVVPPGNTADQGANVAADTGPGSVHWSDTPAASGSPPSYGGSPSYAGANYPGAHAEVGSAPVGGSSPAHAGIDAGAAEAPAPEHEQPSVAERIGDSISTANILRGATADLIGDRVRDAFDNVTGHGHKKAEKGDHDSDTKGGSASV